MKSRAFWWAVPVATVLALVIVSAALAQKSKCKEFKGVINAYTPQTKTTTDGVTTATGPYEVRGPWSLKLKDDGTKADFSAALNMGFSDGWVLTPTGGNGNFDPAARNAHTHHITVFDGQVTAIPNGFQVTGPAMFTLNGGPAPPAIEPSPVVIEITGGDKVEFSNITVTFASPGSKHFGASPLPGVVRSVEDR
jgi:predicted phage tail protein